RGQGGNGGRGPGGRERQEPWTKERAVSSHGPILVGSKGRRNPTIRPDRRYPDPAMAVTVRRFGAQSMTAPLLDVLVKRPGPAFGAAFDDPAHGFLHACDLAVAQREHDRFTEL